jgi:hypothetical protein
VRAAGAGGAAAAAGGIHRHARVLPAHLAYSPRKIGHRSCGTNAVT